MKKVVYVPLTVLSILSVVPLYFAKLFFEAGMYKEAYWLVIVPSNLAVLVLVVYFAVSPDGY